MIRIILQAITLIISFACMVILMIDNGSINNMIFLAVVFLFNYHEINRLCEAWRDENE